MLENIVEPLIEWYEENHRILPWRASKNPYYIWISEIMLQQTRVEAVRPFFERFIKALPQVEDVAVCPEEQLLKLWEGLGYYNRVRNIQKAAIRIVEEYGGRLPADYEKLKDLPGIGNYTAGAVASIAYDLPVPAVDGNVLRVYARIMEDDSDILKQSVKTKVEKEFLEIMPGSRSGTFNQALMELDIDSAENRTFFIFMDFRRFRDPGQPLLVKRHGCRCDRCHTLTGLIIRHYLNGFFRSVTEILSHAAMKMNICQSRNQIAAAAVDYFFSVPTGFRKNFPFCADFFLCKCSLFGIDFCSLDDHCSSSPPSSLS